jgi:hypothetical protein
MVDGRAVEDENAQPAAARHMFERFRHRPQGLPPAVSEETGST